MNYQYLDKRASSHRPCAGRPFHPTTVRLSTHAHIRRRIVVALGLLRARSPPSGLAPAMSRRAAAAHLPPPPRFAKLPSELTTYLVQPGDTMWSIAEGHRHGANLVHYVGELMRQW